MGRYATNRRRGGGGGAPPPPAGPPTLLSAVDQGSGVIDLTFDGPVSTVNPGFPEIGSTEIDASIITVSDASDQTLTTIRITQDVNPSIGGMLQWDFSPPWIVQTINTAVGATIT